LLNIAAARLGEARRRKPCYVIFAQQKLLVYEMGKAGQFFPEFCMKFIRNSQSNWRTASLFQYLGCETLFVLRNVSNNGFSGVFSCLIITLLFSIIIIQIQGSEAVAFHKIVEHDFIW